MNLSLTSFLADASQLLGTTASDLVSLSYSDLIFALIVGLALLALLVWYLTSNNDKTKKIAGASFLLGLCVFCAILLTFEIKTPVVGSKSLSPNPGDTSLGTQDVSNPTSIHLEFLPVHPHNNLLVEEELEDEDILDWKLYIYEGEHNGKPFTEKLFLGESAEITENDIESAFVDPVQKGYVCISLTPAGAEKMRKLTSHMERGKDRLAIVVNGKVKSAPVVQDKLTRNIAISGLNAPGEAEELVKMLTNSSPEKSAIPKRLRAR